MKIARPDLKPAFKERDISVAFSTDGNYLPYVKVAINSLVANTTGGNLDILVLHDGIPQEDRCAFLAGFEEKKNVSVRFVDVQDAVASTGLSEFRQKRYLSVAACYRLLLPDLLVAYDKIIYLDVDTVVCGDLEALHEMEMGEYLFAAALDIVTSGRREYTDWAKRYGFVEWNEYVNTGVIVFNLREFRKAALLDKLISIAMDASQWFCDQDALNFVCKGRIKRLDPEWNVQVGDYCIRQQLAITGDRAYIYHFTGDRKPWSNPEHMMAHHWWRYVGDDGVRLWRNAFRIDGETVSGEGIAVSVVVPVFNAEKYLHEMLVSLSAQTLRNIEIICVDDGSTDGSAAILAEFAARDSRIRIITQTNFGGAVARNRGMNEARGRWLHFADADDFCRPDMLADMLARGETLAADVVVAGRITINCSRFGCCREAHIPESYARHEKSVNCHMAEINIFYGMGFAPWNKLYCRDFVLRNGIRFHQIKSCDDVYFVLVSLLSAEKIAFVDGVYYYYRTFLATSQIGQAEKTPTNFLVALREVRDVVVAYEPKIQKEFFAEAVAGCIENLTSRRTSEAREKIFVALRDGGLASLRLPFADETNVDLGLSERAFRLVMSGAGLVDVVSAHYADHRVALENRLFAALTRNDKLEKRLRDKTEKLNAADERLKEIRESCRADVAKLKERLFAALARSDKLERWLKDKTEKLNASDERLKEGREAYWADVTKLRTRLSAALARNDKLEAWLMEKVKRYEAADERLGKYKEKYRREVEMFKGRISTAEKRLAICDRILESIAKMVE